MSNDQNSTQVDRVIRWVKNKPLFAGLILIGVLVIGLAKFTESLEKLRKFFRPDDAAQSQIQNIPQSQPGKPVLLDDETRERLRINTKVSLESVRPGPEQVRIVPDQMMGLTAIVNYEFPDWLDSMEVSLRVNREPEDGRFWHAVAEKRVTNPHDRIQISGLVPAISRKELKGHRVKVQAEMTVIDNESGQRYLVARSAPTFFKVAK